jgi:hypothetical protein
MEVNKSGYDTRSLELWEKIGKEEYLLRRKELTTIDNKIIYFLIFNFTIVSLFFNFIKIPVDFYGIILYSISSISFLISIILLIYGIWPKKINVILFRHNKKNSYNDEIRVLTKQYENAIKHQSVIVDSKFNILKISSILFFVALLIILVIRIGS